MSGAHPDLLLPTRSGRARIIGFVVAAVVFAAFFGEWIDDHANAVKALPFCEKAVDAWQMALGAAVVAILAALGFAWRAARILLHDQAPPPRAVVFWPTRIRRGAVATLIASIHVLFATALVLLVVLVIGDFIYILWPPAPGCAA